MSSDAQIAANRHNAQASSGPTSPAGRARASRNAVSSGLYSSGDFVRPEEQDLYAEFCAGFQTDLAPEGAIEQTLSAEIVHAAWRLRRCSAIEAGMASDEDARTQQSVDRARAHAHRLFHRATSELRRLQTERRFRIECLPEDFDATALGLASYKDMIPALTNDLRRKLLLHKTRDTEVTKQSQSETGRTGPIAIGTRSSTASNTGRNSPCTCGSGAKFKRCCGKSAPPVLNLAA